MIESARAHLARRLAEAEYLDERDSLRREHKEPGIGCSIVKAETGLFDNLPPDVAIEIDTAADHISRIEHAGAGGIYFPSGVLDPGGVGWGRVDFDRNVRGGVVGENGLGLGDATNEPWPLCLA